MLWSTKLINKKVYDPWSHLTKRIATKNTFSTKMESTQLVGNRKKMIRLNNYIAWEGKLSSIIETIASSADRSAMVTGPATSSKSAKHKHSNKRK